MQSVVYHFVANFLLFQKRFFNDFACTMRHHHYYKCRHPCGIYSTSVLKRSKNLNSTLKPKRFISTRRFFKITSQRLACSVEKNRPRFRCSCHVKLKWFLLFLKRNVAIMFLKLRFLQGLM